MSSAATRRTRRRRRSGRISKSSYRPGLLFFAKPVRNQAGQCFHGGGGVIAGTDDPERGAGAGGEHHQAHDRRAADGLAVAGDRDLGVILLGHLHEFRRGAGVQTLLVDNLDIANDCPIRTSGCVGAVGHLPGRTRLAIVQYLRPAACAAATAASRGQGSRTLASLMSMGRLMPASTSTLGWLITEMARFDGVPPNMSVRMATPEPLSTRLTASRMLLRHCSTSSSGPMVMASICCWGPTTCSKAERNSVASRPWVTSTRPIIPNSPWARCCAARKAAHSGSFGAPMQGPSSLSMRCVALRKVGAKGGLEGPFRRGPALRPVWLIFLNFAGERGSPGPGPRSIAGRRGVDHS